MRSEVTQCVYTEALWAALCGFIVKPLGWIECVQSLTCWKCKVH